MKKKMILCAVMAIIIMLSCAPIALAVEAVPTDNGMAVIPQIGMNMAFADKDGKAISGAEVFLQEDIDTAYVFNGITDKDGKFSLPVVPISNFQMITRDKDGKLTGAIKMHMYPADKTEIKNQPNSAIVPLELGKAKNIAMTTSNTAPKASPGASGAPIVPENVQTYTYEVNVNQKAPAVNFSFTIPADGKILLDAAVDGVLPMPTATPTAEPTATPTAEPTAEPT
ncbi:MAG: hypothetical protein RR797_00655, partial [Christensenella sp.]